MTSDQIKSILDGTMAVGKKFSFKNEKLIDRKFTIRTDNEKTQKLWPEIINEIKTSKVFILADEIGSGKTTTMKNFTIFLKKKRLKLKKRQAQRKPIRAMAIM